MEKVSTLITQHQPESNEPSTNVNRNAEGNHLADRHIDLLWKRMAMIYGHKWVSSYGEADDGTWLSGLHDVTTEQVGAGLEKCRTSTDPWPPTLPQFRAMCLPEKKHACHIEYEALPRPEQNQEVINQAIAKLREITE